MSDPRRPRDPGRPMGAAGPTGAGTEPAGAVPSPGPAAARAEVTDALETDAILNERYVIQGILGEGGVAVTYRATDRTVGGECVVKELRLAGAGDWKTVELFEREAAVLRRLQHPRIPHFVEAFAVERTGHVRLYLVEALVEGRSLAQMIDASHRFTETEAIRFGRRLAEVLAYLHDRRPPVLHRDIKPSNVVVGADGHPHLIDFGAVRELVAGEKRRAGQTMVGSFGYTPLEQFEGAAAPASDVYALGATLIHALTGEDPSNLLDPRGHLRFRDRVTLGSGFVAVLERAVAPQVSDRYLDGAALLADLRRLEAGQRPKARGAGQRRQRRRRGAVAAMMAALLGAAAWFAMGPELNGSTLHLGRGVSGLALSPDGRRLAVGEADGRVGVFDASSLERTWTLERHTVTADAAFSPDGATLALATGARDLWTDTPTPGTLVLLDAASGRRRRTLTVPGGRAGAAVAFSSDGSLVAVAGNRYDKNERYDSDGAIGIFHVASGRRHAVITRDGQPVFSPRFLPGDAGPTLVFVSRAWNGKRTYFARTELVAVAVARVPGESPGRPRASDPGVANVEAELAVAGDGRLALVPTSGEAAVFASPEGKVTGRVGRPVENESFRALVAGAFVAGGLFALPASQTASLPWDKVPGADFTWNWERDIVLWDPRGGAERRVIPACRRRRCGAIEAMAASADGRVLAVGLGHYGRWGKVRVFDVGASTESAP